MRILIQTGDGVHRQSARRLAWGAAALAMALAGTASVSAQDGEIRCAITENGSPSRGTVVVERQGSKVASGSCGRPLAVPAGKCKVTVRLDGALDNPARTVEVEVAPAKTTPVTVDFETAVLEVRVETREKRATGLVAVEKDGRRIGTLGSGVGARLSAGRYQVIVRLGGQEKRYDVDLRPGQRRVVRAQF